MKALHRAPKTASSYRPAQESNFFRTGKASDKFRQLDHHLAWRLVRLLVKKRARNLRAGQADRLVRGLVPRPGLHELLGTIRCPKAA